MSVEFVDTNVLIYAYTSDDEPRHIEATHLLTRLSGERNGALSVQVLGEFCSVAAQKFRMRHEYVEQVVRSMEYWKIHRPGHNDVLQALVLQRQHKLSWWDAMIVNSAIESDATILWSEDLQAGRRFGALTIRNPFQ